jgi:asparagine synthase (glutamine-hydrolysing)
VCGLAGAFYYSSPSDEINASGLHSMGAFMSRRGPDASGTWVHKKKHVGLTHRRLAIIDLSINGNQPMFLNGEELAIVFNGEIYNYHELRKNLINKGFNFLTNTDTEVLLHLYNEYGVSMLKHLRGMFSFAIWDDRDGSLFIARDHFGIKPLYFYDDGKKIIFSSQVKSLLSYVDGIDISPDPSGYVGFLLLGSVPDPHTLYKKIRALPAASYLLIKSGIVTQREYWALKDLLLSQDYSNNSINSSSISNCIEESVSAHLIGDIPLGVFLSGGLDSSIISSICASKSQLISGVTIGFNEYLKTDYDEVPSASKIARFLNMNHMVRYQNLSDFTKIKKQLLFDMDQPSIDGINTYFVSSMARELGMKAALSGIGADEWFGGYGSFAVLPKLVMMPRISWLSHDCSIIKKCIPKKYSPKYSSLLEYCGNWSGAYLLKRGLFLPWELYKFLDKDFVDEGLKNLALVDRLEDTVSGIQGASLKTTSLELTWYMRNQLLRDADWAGMANSLEIRTPFVDIELAANLLKVKKNIATVNKMILRKEYAGILPRDILKKRKTGFSVPLGQWAEKQITSCDVSGEARQWALEVLKQFSPPNAKFIRY